MTGKRGDRSANRRGVRDGGREKEGRDRDRKKCFTRVQCPQRKWDPGVLRAWTHENKTFKKLSNLNKPSFEGSWDYTRY